MNRSRLAVIRCEATNYTACVQFSGQKVRFTQRRLCVYDLHTSCLSAYHSSPQWSVRAREFTLTTCCFARAAGGMLKTIWYIFNLRISGIRHHIIIILSFCEMYIYLFIYLFALVPVLRVSWCVNTLRWAVGLWCDKPATNPSPQRHTPIITINPIRLVAAVCVCVCYPSHVRSTRKLWKKLFSMARIETIYCCAFVGLFYVVSCDLCYNLCGRKCSPINSEAAAAS